MMKICTKSILFIIFFSVLILCLSACSPKSTDGLQFYEINGSYEVNGYTGTDVNIYIPSRYKGKSVKTISKDAFADNTNIKTVTIGNKIDTIESGAFKNCNKLTRITIPTSVKVIESGAFTNCTNLTGVYYLGDIASWCNIYFSPLGDSNPLQYAHNLYFNDKLIDIILLPDSVTKINTRSFEGWNGKEIIFNNGLQEIGYYAFSNCKNLTSLDIPDSVTIIESGAFKGCSELETIDISKNINQINSFTFTDCIELKNIIIPTGISAIESFAFDNCSKLENVYFPNSVNSINSYAFSDCKSLKTIQMPINLSNIEFGTFYNCSNLTRIVIPKNVTDISSSAFTNCNKLTSISYDGTKDQWKTIKKGYGWDSQTGKYIIYCLDGYINKN